LTKKKESQLVRFCSILGL